MSNRRMIPRSLRVAAPVLLIAAITPAVALCATSGTPLDTVYTQATTMFNGPIAGLLILAGLAVVAVMFMMGRGLEGFGFWSGVGMIIGGTFIASALLFMTYFFPTAGALIR
jgi:type IV secretory pathway VirB2 component (pilin)